MYLPMIFTYAELIGIMEEGAKGAAKFPYTFNKSLTRNECGQAERGADN